jgi:hypothetical protein
MQDGANIRSIDTHSKRNWRQNLITSQNGGQDECEPLACGHDDVNAALGKVHEHVVQVPAANA